MAPPGRSDHPRDTTPLNAADIPEDSRMRRNAEKLMSWVEWLLHPEDHDYDRTVIYPPDNHKVEEPGPRYRTDTADPTEIELPFESVIKGYLDVDFLAAMSAVANQEVERGSSLLGVGTAALYNLWWLGNEGMSGLTGDFPSTWTGPASTAANDSLSGIKDVADQVGKIATDLRMMPAKYAMVITGVRDNANDAAGKLVRAFEDRFAEHEPVHMDIVGIMVAVIAGATFTYLTGGAATPIIESAVSSAWSGTLGGAASAVQGNVGAFDGDGWRDIARSYISAQDDMLTEAKKAMDQLNSEVSRLLGLLQNDALIKQFLADHGA
jgi:hypothetical protein